MAPAAKDDGQQVHRRDPGHPAQVRRWDPLAILDDLQEDMARMWNRPVGMWPMMRPLRRLGQMQGGMMLAPRVDAFEKDGNLIVKAELPGVKKEDVQVELEDGNLVIRGECRAESEVKDEDFYRLERSTGTFFRRLPLPFDVQPDQIEANMVDGVLEVRMPKPIEQQSEPKRIAVK
jgi:HSP20 family protein